MAFIKPSTNNTFHCHSPDGLKLITRLRLGLLSHIWLHKFKHNFQDTLNPICNYGTVETTIHYLLHCPNLSNERLALFNKLQSIDENILSRDDSNISKVLLFGDDSFDDVKYTSVLTASIEYILSTKRFDVPFYLSICSLFLVFIKKLLFHLCYLSLYFLHLWLLTLDYFVK